MKKLLRILASGVLGLSMTTGVVLAGNDASVENTGPDSKVEVEVDKDFDLDLDNNNNVDLRSDSRQTARTGNARVHRNTTGEDADTGDAMNDNWTMADVTLDNTESNYGECGCSDGDNSATVDTTGPDSKVEIEFESDVDIDVTNNNNVTLRSNSTQNATSGNATVSRNTTGGGASTGNASNVNTAEFVLNISS